MVDDVDQLTSTIEGARLLNDLIAHAPACLHFLIGSRFPIRGLGRLRATGQLVEIGEGDLAHSPQGRPRC